MKKYCLLLITVFTIFLTGCGSSSKVITCNSKSETNDYTYTSTYKITTKNDKYVKSVTTKEIVTSDNEETLQKIYDTSMEYADSMDELYGGYSCTGKIDGNKLIVTTTIEYDKMDTKAFRNAVNGASAYVDENGNILLDGVKAVYALLGAKCDE